jgi:hypothetical protein
MPRLPREIEHRRRQTLSAITLMLEFPERVEPDRWARRADELRELGEVLTAFARQRPQRDQD